ncbi:hypothetical protein PV396_40775 [Streptomyces sp. ME02-8801-2C]|uniref:hypothetical protein n=1 Tax=Streptomyces sp. ME02-8801-2C TaxID=3028680 RepID=UPI0029AB8920|nr:hypothetical protein [Streptomyces sp. ME02-8801-2C]MDX3458202.1 hypothetical protein [Streptomyces sp. ME02-8801-2C]
MTLWAITSYFNPAGYRTRFANYQLFRQRLNVPLITVEHSPDGRFELGPADADILVQLSGGSTLWQKERLLNVALDRLPENCTAVAWIDCDVVLEDDDWARLALRKLETAVLLQPFSRAREVRADQIDDPPPSAVVRPSFALQYVEGALVEERLRTWRIGTDPVPLHCGYAWVARAEVILRHGLYDASIVGGGTRELASTAIDRIDHLLACRPRNEYQREHLLEWAKPFAEAVDGRVDYLDGDLVHLWHGDVSHRGYGTRYQMVADLGFDPTHDIAVAGGCWEWSSDKPELHRRVHEYFAQRREDG